MTSSGYTTHLALWREIVSNYHKENKPINQHVDHIRKLFDELDADGFTWSKESILDIFIQLFSSQSSQGSFSSINKLTESHLNQRIEKPSNEIKQFIQNQELKKKPRPAGLMDLPIEIMHDILEYLDDMDKSSDQHVYFKKLQCKVKITVPGDHTPYTIYMPPDLPILNSTQSLSVVSREIYQLCEPWLWRKLRFPTDFPAPICLWTEDILLNRGPHVRSLILFLSENCAKPASKFVYDPFYDNLILGSGSMPEKISPQNAKDLIDRCPNLSTLNLYYSPLERSPMLNKTEDFLLDLIPLISSLEHLQHLSLDDEFRSTFMKEFPSKVISNLPLLKSLKIRGHTASENHQKFGDGSFGSNLSKLKYLTRLQLWYNHDINESWCLYDWSGTITDLEIHHCGGLRPSSALRIFNHISPHLRTLTISFCWDQDFIRKIEPSWIPKDRPFLPLLSDLNFSARNPYFLSSFRECKSLSHLNLSCQTLKHCSALNKMLSDVTWPYLKTLEVVASSMTLPQDESGVFEELKAKLLDYCKQQNVTVKVHHPHYDWRDWE